MKFLEKNLTAGSSGEQVKSAIPCTFRAHAAALKSAATVRYVDDHGVDKTFYALKSSLNPLFAIADHYDDDVIVSCLAVAGYRSGRDLTDLENALKTATAKASPLEKRDADLRRQALACRDQDKNKHDAILKEIDKAGPALAAARDEVSKAEAALRDAVAADIRKWLSAFDKRAQMLAAVSKWLYENAANHFAEIAAAADEAVRERAKEFSGRMLAFIDEIVDDDAFPINWRGRRCACADNVENSIIKAVKRPFNGGVGYKHLATGGTRYCNVPLKSGQEVTIEKVTD